MRIFDEKDVAIVAQTINSVAPENPRQRALLVLLAAKRAGVLPQDMREAIWWDLCHKD